MQTIEYSECLRDIISLSIIAKEYYNMLNNADDKQLYEMSMRYIKNKDYNTCMSNGVKEKCINLIEETWDNVSNAESFYQYLLVNVYCNEVVIESLYIMFEDMSMYCQERIKKME